MGINSYGLYAMLSLVFMIAIPFLFYSMIIKIVKRKYAWALIECILLAIGGLVFWLWLVNVFSTIY